MIGFLQTLKHETPPPVQVIGVTGLYGAGKKTLASYLKERSGMEILSLEDIARELATREHITPTRENLREIMNRYCCWHGKDHLINRAIHLIAKKGWKKVVVPGIRLLEEIVALRRHFGADFRLVHVEASSSKASRKRVADIGVLFSATRPYALDTDENQAKMEEIAEWADVRIPNYHTIEEFKRAIDRELIRKKQIDWIEAAAQSYPLVVRR